VAGLAVAIGVVGAAHGGVGAFVIEQALALADDGLGVGADETHRSGVHRLGALGHVAHDQYRLAQ
jgi:hypothetical protein